MPKNQCCGTEKVDNLRVRCDAKIKGDLTVRDDADFRGDVRVRGDLTVDGGIFPLRRVDVALSEPETVPTGAALRTKVAFDVILTPQGLPFDTATNTFIAPTAGIYAFSTLTTWEAAAGATARGVGVKVNGTEIHFTSNLNLENVPSQASDSVTARLAQGDQVIVQVAHNSAAALDILQAGTFLSIVQLR